MDVGEGRGFAGGLGGGICQGRYEPRISFVRMQIINN